jgi:putative SOS response-associated peptidase YedK
MLVQNGRAPRPVTNVRDDKILASRFWRSSFEQRRCLVPATSFCEPNGDVKPATWQCSKVLTLGHSSLFRAFGGSTTDQ